MPSVSAIIALIDDDDPVVRDSLAQRFQADPQLTREVWHQTGEPRPRWLADIAVRHHAAEIIAAAATIQTLEAGVALLPRLEDPYQDWQVRLDQVFADLASRLADSDDPLILAHRLHHEFGFAGDSAHYHDPANTLMPYVLERRLGLPLSLTTLWLLLCRRVGFTGIHALAVPGHVYAAWQRHAIDCFHNARPVPYQQVVTHARGGGGCDDRDLFLRMARNLVVSYQQAEDLLRQDIVYGIAFAR